MTSAIFSDLDGKVKEAEHTVVRKLEIEAYVVVLLVHNAENLLGFGPVGGEKAAVIHVALVELLILKVVDNLFP